MMTGRERILKTLAHETPDRVPVDFGGCNQTTVHAHVVAELRDYYGLEKRKVKVEEPYTMMGRLDGDLKSAMGVDVDAVTTLGTFFGPPRDTWKDYTMEDGLEVLVPADFNVTRDEDGDIYAYPMGDISVLTNALGFALLVVTEHLRRAGWVSLRAHHDSLLERLWVRRWWPCSAAKQPRAQPLQRHAGCATRSTDGRQDLITDSRLHHRLPAHQ